MAEYYLISQLPSLDGIDESLTVPITEQSFLELCRRILDQKTFSEIEKLTLVPPKSEVNTDSSLVGAWYNGERDLRLALAKARADKLNKPFDLQNKSLSQELSKIVNSAVETENPLQAENLLLQYRLSFLETLRPMDTFSKEFLFYYALRLKLISRMRQFDSKLGEATYKNIYNSILNGDSLEA